MARIRFSGRGRITLMVTMSRLVLGRALYIRMITKSCFPKHEAVEAWSWQPVCVYCHNMDAVHTFWPFPRIVYIHALKICFRNRLNLKSRSLVQRIRGIFEDDIKASFHALGFSISPAVRICISLSDGRRVWSHRTGDWLAEARGNRCWVQGAAKHMSLLQRQYSCRMTKPTGLFDICMAHLRCN
jgi:hypothetical protein